MERDESILSICLYFTSNRFARYMTKIAEEAFAEEKKGEITDAKHPDKFCY